MSITAVCDICKEELNELGALALSPPEDNRPYKYHICIDCWEGRVKILFE